MLWSALKGVTGEWTKPGLNVVMIFFLSCAVVFGSVDRPDLINASSEAGNIQGGEAHLSVFTSRAARFAEY